MNIVDRNATNLDQYNRSQFREAITTVEKYLLTLEQTECPVKHYFCNGMYAREIFIPKGTVLTGAIHKTEHLCVLSGDIEITSEERKGRYTGYFMFKSEPGEKRIGYAHEDTYFTTLHITDETDTEKLWDILVVDSYEDYLKYLIYEAQDDYKKFLVNYNLTEEHIKPIIENNSDVIDLDESYDYIYIDESWIDKKGTFTKRAFKQGEYIGPARISDKRTIIGRYTNHSNLPNAYYILQDNGDLDLYAKVDITVGEELLIDYNHAMEVNGYTKRENSL